MPTIKKHCHRPWQPKREPQQGRQHSNTKFYQSTEWRKLRAVRLNQQPLCEECLSREVHTPAGIDDPKITAHSLRHTCGSLLVEMGLDVEMIKDLLGHSNTATTRIYIEQAQRRRLIEENPGNLIGELITKRTKK